MADKEADLVHEVLKLGCSLYYPWPAWPKPEEETLKIFVSRLKDRVDSLLDLFQKRIPLKLRIGRIGVDPKRRRKSIGMRNFYIDRPSTWDPEQVLACYKLQREDSFNVMVGIGIVSKSYMPADLVYLADGDVEWGAVEVQRRLVRECQRCSLSGPLVDSDFHGDQSDLGPFDARPCRAYLIYVTLKLAIRHITS